MSALVLSIFLTLAAPQASTHGGAIEGTVTRFGTGDPLPNVEILINAEGRPLRYLPAQAITDSAGRFVIDDILPGVYTIKAQRAGYANPAPGGVRVGEGGTNRTLTVAAGQRVQDANLTMIPGGAVTGRVLDLQGKPIVDRGVSARSTDELDYRYASTDDRGEYHFAGLAPAKYYVSADPGNDEVETYFPGVADKANATVLEIAEGGILSGIDFSIQTEAAKTFMISGKLVHPDGSPINGMISGIRLVPRGSAGPASGNTYRDFGTSGYRVANAMQIDFGISGVRPGSYELYVSVGILGNGMMLDPSASALAGRAAIDVGNEDLKGVTVVTGGVDVKGQLVVASPAPTPSGSLRLRMMPEDVQSRKVRADTAGTFAIPNVLRGTWKAEVSDLSADVAVLDVRQGKASVFESGIVVDDQPPEPIQIILGAAGAIDGIVRDGQQGVAGGAQVILIPSAPNETRPALYRTAITDGQGHFTLSNVATGAYLIFALDPDPFGPGSIPESAEGLRAVLIPAYQSQGATLNVASGTKAGISIAIIRKQP